MITLDDFVTKARTKTLMDASVALDLRLKKSGSESVGPCLVCGGTDRFAVNYQKNVWNCRGCQKGGDAISLIMHARNCDFLSACELLLNEPRPNGPKGEYRRGQSEANVKLYQERQAVLAAKQERDLRRRLNRSGDIWHEAVELSGAPADYLRSRGLDPKFADENIRAHRGLPHPDGGTFPALIAKVMDKSGNLTGVWRVYVKADGSGKAPVGNARLGLGSVGGGACRLGGLWPRIAAAEGIEKSIAVRMMIFEASGEMRPVWPLLSAQNMASFDPPEGIEAIDLYADGDPPRSPKGRREQWLPSPGLKAAWDLASKLPIPVVVHASPPAMDWEEVYVKAKGRERVA